MGLQTFQIIFDNPHGVYFAGQTVQGHVNVCITGEPKKTRGIKLRFVGSAEVHWTEQETRTRTQSGGGGHGHHGHHGHHHSGHSSHGGHHHGGHDHDNQVTHTESHTIHFSSSESYFDMNIYLFGNGTSTIVPVGNHFFPFTFVLPTNIPSSFEADFGHIRYYIRATIDRPWKFDHNTKSFFTVNSILDLNTDVGAMIPLQGMDEKHLCCLCCRNGPISALVNLPRTGYVPGEYISVSAEVANKSSRKMDKSQVKLLQMTTFHARSRHGTGLAKQKSRRKLITSAVRGAIEPGQTDLWSNFPLLVPPIPPSVLAYCSLMELKYWLEFHVDPSGLGFDLVVSLPITIGTIPLSSTFSSFQVPFEAPGTTIEINQGYPPQQGLSPAIEGVAGGAFPPQNTMRPQQTQGVPSAPPLPINQYPDLPNPTYANSVFGANANFSLKGQEDNEHTEGNWDYVPKYITYASKNGV